MKLYASAHDRLANQQEALRHILDFCSEARMTARPAGKWSIHDNIAHLAKYQPVFLERMRSILAVDDPLFERYKAEDDPFFEEWRQWSTESLLVAIDRDRQEILRFMNGLSEAELARCGTHLHFGRLTMLEWVEFFLLHEAHHLFTIFRLAHDPVG